MHESVPTLLIPREPGALCQQCRKVAHPDIHAIQVVYSEQAVKISAARGCALCRTLFEDLICNLFTASSTKHSLELSRREGNITVFDFNNTSHSYELVDTDCEYILSRTTLDLLDSIYDSLSYSRCGLPARVVLEIG